MYWLIAIGASAAMFAVGFRFGHRRPSLAIGHVASDGRDPDRSRTTDTDSDTDGGDVIDVALAIVEQHPTGVVVVDRDGGIIYRNRSVREMRGNHVGVLIDAAVERHVEQIRSSGDADPETIELYGPPPRVVHLAAEPLPGGAVVTYVDDVTEAKRLDRIRTDFVANISHELKTPIGAMSVLAETMVGVDDTATLERVTARLIGEADRASRTIDDLMELSRIESDRTREHETLNLTDLVSSAVGRVSELSTRRGIVVSSDVPAHATISGQRSELESAIGNLVENAVKYSDDGGSVRVEVIVDDEWLSLAVIDFGVGIPKSSLDRIFERFYRVDRARSRATGGTGLGLAIVRHTATNHGGEVTVHSVEGEGSTFTLRLPLHRPDKPAIAPRRTEPNSDDERPNDARPDDEHWAEAPVDRPGGESGRRVDRAADEQRRVRGG